MRELRGDVEKVDKLSMSLDDLIEPDAELLSCVPGSLSKKQSLDSPCAQCGSSSNEGWRCGCLVFATIVCLFPVMLSLICQLPSSTCQGKTAGAEVETPSQASTEPSMPPSA